MKRLVITKERLIDIISVLCLLVGLSRGLIYSNRYTVIICIILGLLCLLWKRTIWLNFTQVLYIISIIYIYLNKYQSYSVLPCLYISMACVCFLLFREQSNIAIAMIAICAFSAFNVFVNVLGLVFPGIHQSMLRVFLNSSSYESALQSMSQGYMVGLSDHYSRNAFYCVAGGSVLISIAMARDEKKIPFYFFAVIEIAMIMIIGKRAHFLFLVAAIIVTYIFMADRVSKGIRNFLTITVVITIILALMIEFIPAVSFVTDRLFNHTVGTDYSNGRFRLWQIAIDAFKEKPIFGQGFGYFNSTVRTGFLQQTYAGVHNDYLQWLCEQGIVGFVMNIVPMFSFYWLSIKELKLIVGAEESDVQSKAMIIWSVIIQTFVIIYSLTGIPHFDYEVNTVYCFSIAVTAAFYKYLQSPEQIGRNNELEEEE